MNRPLEDVVVWFLRVTVVGLMLLGHLALSQPSKDTVNSRFTPTVVLDSSQVVQR
jgi:hypothetical protein